MAIAPRGMPVIPPEGIAPVTDPASTGTAPDASPTTMVLQYLKSRGFQPTSENVRRALEANQRDPGVIPGLRSDRPATDAEDMAAMAAAGRGGGPRTPYQPSGTGGAGDTTPIAGSPNTSAPPPVAGDGSAGSDAAKIAALVLGGGAGMGAAGYGAYRAADRLNPEISPRPTPGSSVPPMSEVGTNVPGMEATSMPPSVAPPPEAQVTPLDTAMNRAVPQVPGDLNPVARPGSLDMTPPRGPVSPVAGAEPPVIPLPPRVTPTDVAMPAPTTSTTLRGVPSARVVPPRVRARLNLR